ncbi:MAG TPA: AI-2E family transporter [Armatimonadota bacterium]|nr:AI-2E family transporter [Armatimonadota bacterium]
MKQTIQVGTTLLLIASAIVLFVLALQKLAALAILITIAIIITTGIDPLVHRIEAFTFRNRRLPRALATFLVLLLGILIILGILSFLITTAVSQAINFAHNEKLQNELFNWVVNLSSRHTFIPKPDVIFAKLHEQSGRIVQYLWSTTVAIFGILGSAVSVVTVFILSFFFSTYKDGITYTIMQLVPPAYQQRTREIAHHAAEKMGGWLRGQLTLALMITSFIAVGMSILGYPSYAILVGIIGGIGELIPMVGPYMAFFPAIAIVLLTGGALWQIIAVVAFFILLSQFENYVLAPKIMEKNVGLHPVSTILALLTGGSLLGLVGALLAIPLAAGLRIIMLEAVFPAIQHKSTQTIQDERPEAVDTERQISSPSRKQKRRHSK